ncbi:MAG: alkaline phosphatase [Hyphomonas sp.]|uniref:alkaline phosphatase D family protein n=1 Tax=Hyphomonas sp. TaxID=87 RepID=UPI0017D59049|nr:alkaline phosphatase D family protein [Hyphomonas sp.]MBA3067756.1 alkaline phosphatase [Hyphomonas sp.]MBU3920017.1 alkaline phosphatase D family protein [Alphaproteobacteria bacterium]MBU4062156.1 alkaline phosphatase D family protein [Alphaproteobacteria bacterium]MBU4165591.1 alkaline phosphatase D family protein [Alphaproteobacteria bacterium]
MFNDLSRRRFMLTTSALFGVSLIDQKALAAANGGHFSLGVASGSPRADQVILWTRLAPDPLNGGGMAPEPAKVRVRLARDPAMMDILIDDFVTAHAAEAHSVHFSARGLEPGREYWYQFSYGTDESPVGRTRTSDPKAGQVKIALAYCQHYESGFYAAYRDLAAWSPDCVIHTGDYIYEGDIGTLGAQMRPVGGGERRLFETVRLHNSAEIVTLWDYRNRHALYRTDPDLQSAHAGAPWIVGFDDHEIDNNWAGNTPQDPEKQTHTEFLLRKMAAMQAYYEHMPIEKPPLIAGLEASLQIYGAYRLGPAQVHMLDTRQFRSDQPCGDNRKAYCEEALSDKRTILGKTQEAWLKKSLERSKAAFNVLATQVWFTPYRYNEPPEAPVVNLDSWDGYPVARQNLSDILANDVSNPVLLTGDWHCAMASTVYQRPFDPSSKRIGHELVGGPISSGCPWARDMEQVRAANPHVSHLNGRQRGYLRTTFTADTCNAEFRVVEDVGRPDSAVLTDIELRTKDL